MFPQRRLISNILQLSAPNMGGLWVSLNHPQTNSKPTLNKENK